MDIEEIRKRKLEELTKRNEEAVQDELLLRKQIQVLEQTMKPRMTREAYSRYSTLKVAHKDLSVKALVIMNHALQARKINLITDEILKELLMSMQDGKDYNIIRK